MSNPADTRAEAAFRAAFAEHADRFEPAPLAPVSGRPRRPRARRIGIIAAAASVLLVLGTTVGVALWRGQPADRTPAEDVDRPTPGWRYETYRNVRVEVPDSWGYALSPDPDWCAGGRERITSPYVDTRTRFTWILTIACGGSMPERMWVTRLRFADATTQSPTKTVQINPRWVEVGRSLGGVRVSVRADKAHLAQARRIVDSATIVEEDQYGCTPTVAATKAPAGFDVTELDDVDTISVCQYALDEGERLPWLLASRQLTGAAADAVLAGIKAAPLTTDDCRHPTTYVPDIMLLLNRDGRSSTIYLYTLGCTSHGLDDGTNQREFADYGACSMLFGDRVTIAWITRGMYCRR